MNEHIDRRAFLARSWKGGVGLIALAGAWTSWDLLSPGGARADAEIRTVAADQVPAEGIVEVPAARAYLTRQEGEVVAISDRCPHLGCRVPYCESSGQFECPCHGSVFNRLGEYREGPTPRGMDRYPVRIEDGVVFVDVATLQTGPERGAPESIDEPPTGPSCAGE